MCGIFGYVTKKRAVGGPRALGAALRALRHRGPDDEASIELTSGDSRCGLAHTRLAIIDLSPAGRQPMSTADGRFTLVYNGEVYNHPELRKQLEALGVSFRGTSDTEVLLEAFARWGEAAIPRFRGMFALGIWDADRRSLLLARDHMGIKPLYFTAGPDGLAFASEVRALVAAGFAEPRPSRRAIASYLATGSVAEPDTIFEGVSPLPPGTILEYTDAGPRLSPYWELPLETAPPADRASAIEDVRATLADAIRLRLVADVPLGVFLSGGMDSTVIASFAARASSRPLNTFTVTFDEEAYSEERHAAEVARRIGSEHHQVRLSGGETMKSLPAAIDALDQPSVDGFNTYFVSKAARAAGLKVALSGLGGDEVFAGYASFSRFGPLLAAGRAGRRMMPLFDRAARALGKPFGALPQRGRKLLDALRAGGSPEKTYGVMRSMFDLGQISALLSPELAHEAASLPLNVPERLEPLVERGAMDPENAYSALEISNYLRNTLLRDTDVMSMSHALEVRVPLVDHVLVERVIRLPGDMKVGGGLNKPLLAAAAGDLPESVLRRPKMGFCLPFAEWMKGPLRGWAEEALLGEATRRLGFLNADAVARLWRAFLEGDRRVSASRVFCLITLAAYFGSHEALF
ncbi:asparagine synthase (glutamine-hydrolyzing) [Polyangium aurulentum]|uniref:asparagine synthase (glutamine-hydrolyzing) n=1 Tax=Polyangium aurulentum TaxID=2567896 RepID=UPI0010AE5B91|nr:asparagine synthase (glutamine-hydrolyzing) [Polyangium aurulentum]UQA62392.1 asparagine synthase (glutamine-hydrolyzing) [Polyangium aurulentum]